MKNSKGKNRKESKDNKGENIAEIKESIPLLCDDDEWLASDGGATNGWEGPMDEENSREAADGTKLERRWARHGHSFNEIVRAAVTGVKEGKRARG